MPKPAEFRLSLLKFVKDEVPKHFVEIQRKIMAELLTMIVQATPVGNNTRWKHNMIRAQKGLPPLPKGYVGGHARKNWQVTIGSNTAVIKPGVDSTGQGALSEGYRIIGDIRQPVVGYITNPLPYMQPLEEGHSKQAPAGMVRNAIAAITTKYGGAK